MEIQNPPRPEDAPAAAAGSRLWIWWAALVASGAATAAVHLHLASLPDPDIPEFLRWFGAAFVIYVFGMAVVRRLRARTPALVLVWVFLVAGASMLVYLASPLLLSSEVHRYRWDGAVAEAGLNPYEYAPQDPEVRELRADFPDEIPAPERRAFYPPLSEFLFYALARLDLDGVFHYRLLLIVAGLLCGLPLIVLCRAIGVPAVHAAMLLWHPLFVVETAANAHLESLAILLALVSLALLVTRHHLTPALFLGLATLARAFPLVMLPLYLRRVPPYRLVLFVLVLAAGVLPFAAASRGLGEGVVDYLQHARFNPGPFIIVEEIFRWFGALEWARPATALMGLAIAIALYLTDDGSEGAVLRRAFYLTLPPLFLGPVVHPWTLLWILPFLAMLPGRKVWRVPLLYLSGSVALAYLYLEWGELPTWVTALEYGPVALLLLWNWGRRARRRRAAA